MTQETDASLSATEQTQRVANNTESCRLKLRKQEQYELIAHFCHDSSSLSSLPREWKISLR